MNKIYLCLAAFCGLLCLASGQLMSKGPCPDDIKVMEDFNAEQYMGKWYEFAKYPIYFENNGKCITAQYALNENGIVSVNNTMIDQKSNNYTDIIGNATLVSSGKLLVKFPVSPILTVSSNYWVLDTNYGNYSVVYSCVPLTKYSHTTTVWILTRTPFPGDQIVEKAVKVLKDNNISLMPLQMTNHISCN